MMKLTISLFAILFLTSASALLAQAPIQKQKWHWNQPLQQDTVYGYAQVVRVDNVLYISGAVARDITPDGIQQVYRALEMSLKSQGATFLNVVKENLYTTDIAEMEKYKDARKPFYNGDYPAATWVQVSRLLMPDAKLEIELIAHLPKQ